MRGRVDEAGHLFILGGQISDGIECEVHQLKFIPGPGGGHVPNRHLDPMSNVLGAQPVDHGGGEVDARNGHTAICQRQRHAARADGELERRFVSSEFGQDINGRTKPLGANMPRQLSS